jgi:uncharacterized coiled-coil DUF342 family protein
MLAELSTTLSTYYRSPSCKNRKTKNVIYIPIGNNMDDISDITQQRYSTNRAILNNFNGYMPFQNRATDIATPSLKSSNFFPNKVQNISFLYNPQNISSDIPINNYNKIYGYKNIKTRPKSAIKTKINNNLNKGRIPYNNKSFSFANKYKRNKNIVSKINKSSLSPKDIGENMTNNYEDYDLNYNMNNFDNMISSINRNGFQRIQDEINDKKIIVSQLENSIAMLKNKICLCKSRTYSGLHKESKNRIKYENMLSVSNRYKNIGKTADNYKDDINNFQNKIAMINNETLKLKTIGFDIQNEINSMNEEIRKGNKAISDKQKEIENLLPALQLLRNHITSVKQKLFRYNNVKQNYLGELSYIESNI